MAIINDVTEVLHKIEAKLYPNYLGKGEGAYVVRSKAEAPLSIEDICASAKNRGGFTGQYEDLVEHAHIFIDEMIYQLLDGFSAQIDGYFSLHTHIGGTYKSGHDLINGSNISITFRELVKLKELLAKVKVENNGVARDGAYIDEIVDTGSGAVNSVITPGSVLYISGNKIKIEGNGDCGVWLVDQATQVRMKLDTRYAVNRGSEVVVFAPAVLTGQYKLEIVTQFSHGRQLKEPRVIQADCVLTAAQ